jgi:hypothetical protein
VYATLNNQNNQNNQLGSPAAIPVSERHLNGSGGGTSLVLRMWEDQDDARAAAGDNPVWTVAYHFAGPDVTKTASIAHVIWFDGPRSKEQAASERRAGEERIWPAVQDVTGLVDVVVLERPDNAVTVLSFFTNPAAVEEHVRRVMSTELLPGEDPDLLTGPDRIETFAVSVPQAAASPR